MKSLARRLAGLLGLRVFSLAIVFLQTIALTRFFGPEVFGQFSFAVSVATIAMLAITMGLDQVLMRDLARVGRERAAQVGSWVVTYLFAQRFTLILSLLSALMGTLLFAVTDLGGVYTPALIWVFALVPFMVGRKFIESLLLGDHRPGASLMGSQMAQPLAMVLGVGIFMALGWAAELGTLLTLFSVATILSTLTVFWLARGLLPQLMPAPGVVRPELDHYRLMQSGWSFALITLGFVIGQHIDVLLIGIFGSPSEAAVVRIATRLAEMAGLVRAIAILQFKPRLAAAYGRRDMATVQRQARQLATIFMGSGLLMTAGLLLFAEQAMSVFGEEFAIGAWPLRFYVLGVFFTMICGPCSIIMTLCDQERTASRILWVALGTQIALDVVLIPLYGPLGCAIANFVSMLILGGAGLILTRTRLGIDTTIFSYFRTPHSGEHRS
ncbi:MULTISPECIES: lipopolysaccharide biosynthesis protein [Roseobacteraceae]|uniref:lipopolysaccharide biosynthesis protein n=1 Tax=Roseobacteraceae TaxID=2854170 RepID=UPI0031D6594A